MDSARLALEINCELEHLRRLADQASRILAVPATERREWDAAAGAKFIADLWLGFENLCKRRYVHIGQEIPRGPDSHSRMLADFLAAPVLGAAIPPDKATRIRKYLAFRHRFVHGYGDEMVWSMVEEPLRLLPDTVETLVSSWSNWLASAT